MKSKRGYLVVWLLLSAMTIWATDANDRFKGGSYDGSALYVTIEYASLAPPPGTLILVR